MTENFATDLKGSLYPWRRWPEALIALVGVLLSLGTYLATLAPGVLDGDSGEFQYASYSLGLPHPTGYPLYVLIGRLWAFLPLGTIAYRMNLLSAVFGTLAIGGCFLLARQVGVGRTASLAASLGLAASALFWSQSVIAEVYTLNALLMVLTLNFAVAASHSTGARQYRLLQAAAFSFGLGLAHHRTIVFILPGLVFYLWPAFASLWRKPRQVVGLALLIALPLILYLYIPLRAPNLGLAGSLRYALGSSYGVSLWHESPLQLLARLATFGHLALGQFTAVGTGVCLLGASISVRRQPRLALLVGLTVLAATLFYLEYDVFDADVFLLPAYAVTVIWLALGLDVVRSVLLRVPLPRLRVAMGLLPFLIPLALVLVNYGQQDQSANSQAATYWSQLLDEPLDWGAAMVGGGWQLSTLRYYQATAGRRTDLEALAIEPQDPTSWGKLASWLDGGHSAYLLHTLTRAPAKYQFGPFGDLTMIRPASVEERSPQVAAAATLSVEGINLVGYSPSKPKLTAGETATIDVIWQSVASTTRDYVTYLHVIDERTGTMIAQQDKGALDYFSVSYPTSHWTVGEEMRDLFQLAVPPNTPAGAYLLEAGLYLEKDGAISANNHAVVGRLVVLAGEDTAPASAKPPLAELGGKLRLLEARRDPAGSVSPGQQVRVTLSWQAIGQIGESYTTFVQLIDQTGRLVVQDDGLPVDGRYPTTLWDPLERVSEEKQIAIPPHLPPGEYRLFCGGYNSANQHRLLMPDGTDWIDLGILTVK